MIRVLVAEDSVTTREFLVEIVRSDPEIEVVGEAKNGREALEMTKQLRPDVVLMDVQMPEMDGFEATKRIMVEAPTPIVLISASLDVREVEISMHALRAGALTVLPKPPGIASPGFEDAARQFVQTIKAMSQVKVVRHWPERGRQDASAGVRAATRGTRARIVAITASTGGPAALNRLLSDLPGGFPVPILVVQHLSPGFLGGFAAWLNLTSSLKVKAAQDGESLLPGTVYLAPDNRHLGVSDRSTILLSEAAPIAGFRPSGTYLFDSVARTYGSSTLALVLTGMGQDGVEGLRRVREAGGRVIAQDETTSVVFGIPGAAVAAGCVDSVLPISAMALRLGELV